MMAGRACEATWRCVRCKRSFTGFPGRFSGKRFAKAFAMHLRVHHALESPVTFLGGNRSDTNNVRETQTVAIASPLTELSSGVEHACRSRRLMLFQSVKQPLKNLFQPARCVHQGDICCCRQGHRPGSPQAHAQVSPFTKRRRGQHEFKASGTAQQGIVKIISGSRCDG